MRLTTCLRPLVFFLSATLFAEDVTVKDGDVAAESQVSPLESIIQPRNEGAFWIYTSAYFEDGQRYSGGTSKEEVIQIIEIDGTKCWKVRLTMDWRSILDRLAGAKLAADDYDYFWEYFNAEGSYNFADWGDGDALLTPKTLADFELTLPYPTKKGHRYSAEGSAWEVLDDAALIRVPAGEFTCIVYRSIDETEGQAEDDWQNRFYMSPGVGMVRWEGWIKQDGEWVLDMQDDLVKFDLNETASASE